jgi:hypothetical protein
MHHGPVIRWIPLPWLLRRCPLQPPEVRRLGWSSPSPEPRSCPLHNANVCNTLVIFVHKYVTSVALSTVRLFLHSHIGAISASLPRCPMSCRLHQLDTDDPYCSPRGLSYESSASHLYRKAPYLPTALLTLSLQPDYGTSPSRTARMLLHFVPPTAR